MSDVPDAYQPRSYRFLALVLATSIMFNHRKLCDQYEINAVLEYFWAFLDAKIFLSFVLGMYLWEISLCLVTCVTFSLLYQDLLWIVRRLAK